EYGIRYRNVTGVQTCALPIYNEMSRLGHVPKTEVLDLQIVKPSSKLCEYFNVKESDQLIYLHRRRFADDNPIVTVETYLPYEYRSEERRVGNEYKKQYTLTQ